MRSSRAITAPLIKSALFVLVTGLSTLILAVMVASAEFDNRTTYHAIFTDVTGVNPGDSVRIAGVRVGQVDDIRLHGKRLARLSFSVERGRKVPATVTASIKYLNLVGQRYIDLRQAPVDDATAATLGASAPGATLPPGGTIGKDRTSPALNLTELFRGFQPLMQALNPKDVNKLSHAIIKTLQGEGSTVESLLRTIASLTTTLANRDKLIGDTIKNLSDVTDTVNTRSKQLSQLVVTLKKLVSGLAADRKPIGRSVVALGDLAETGADFFEEVTPPFKPFVKQLGRLAGNLDKDRPLLERFLRRLPGKIDRIGKTAQYGSWANFYLCQALVEGIRTADGRPPPPGVIVDQPRCQRS